MSALTLIGFGMLMFALGYIACLIVNWRHLS